MANKFSYVNSVEELDAELAGATRDINEVLVHWTTTFLDEVVTAESIEATHKSLGFDEIVFHYIIHRDGTLQRGKDINKVSEHGRNLPAPEFARSNYTIGVAFVGGVNLTFSEAKALGATDGKTIGAEYAGSDSFTDKQFETFDSFMQSFFWVFPYGQAVGHVDIPSADNDDPGFDVGQYCNDKWGKIRIVNPSEGPSISTSELIAKAFSRGSA